MASTELQHLTADDPLIPHLECFTTKTTPQIDQLKQLHRDLLAELATLSIFFAEKPDQPVEEVFTTILSFSLTLQKASVEMSKYPDPPKKPIPVLHTTAPSSGNDTTPTATLVRHVGLGKGTMTRGELDEAIRSIHGGVRRRERREVSMTSTAGSSVKLSRMFLDGAGSSVRATVGRGTVSKRTRLGSVFN